LSSDNGVYIGRFPVDNRGCSGFAGYEYRVIHAQAIENCDFSTDFPQELTDASIVEYYGNVKPTHYREEAWKEAQKLYDEIMSSDFPILEYGISEIVYTRPFPKMTIKEAQKVSNDYWDNFQKEKIKKGLAK
jgi:hypothetical protein